MLNFMNDFKSPPDVDESTFWTVLCLIFTLFMSLAVGFVLTNILNIPDFVSGLIVGTLTTIMFVALAGSESSE